MSKQLPILAPGWATDPNYAAGSDPWSGTATRIQPASGVLAKGFIPAKKPAAQYLNWAVGSIGDNTALTAQIAAHNALQAWRLSSVPVNGANGNTQIVAVPAGALQQKILYAFEADTTHSNNTWWTRSNDGSVWLAKAGISSAFPSLTDAAAGAAGTILLVDGTSSSVEYTTNYGVTWANQSVGLAASLSSHYGLGQYWLCQRGTIYTANTPAALVSGLHPAITIPGGGSFSGIPEFADNASNTVCMVANATGGTAPTYPSVYATTDGGVTWSKVFDLTGATSANIKYDPNRTLFIVWDDTGAVSTSSNGTVWTRGTAVTGSAAAGMVTGPRTFAIAGPAIAKLWSQTLGGQLVDGIAYSFDLGASWFVSAFASTGGAPTQLRGANNRLYALSGGNLWVSGILGANDKDF